MTQEKKSILIVTGETSGDMHASELVKHLKGLNSGLRFYGVGGKGMEAEGVELVERMEKISIIGLSEVFAKLPRIHAAYKKIMAKVSEDHPTLVILIDYPGFNLRIAKMLKAKGIPVIYYITPQVWAWGKSRISLIKKYVDKALVIFKFEEELFKSYGIDATFVGHPLLDNEKKSSAGKSSFGLEEGKFTIALLPGSRTSEVRRKLPLMMKAAAIIAHKKDAQFTLLKSSSVEDTVYEDILKDSPIPITSIKDDTYGCLSASDFVLTSSGTATLESAIMEKPLIITYKTSLLTAILFKIVARTPYIGLVNVIAKREVAPEILQYDATAEKLASSILSIISSKEKMEKQVRDLKEVKRAIGGPGASKKAAEIINNFIKLQR
ncbi:lipid-A-disaccharide synthase [Candidatus Omnitrophota bacterium]